MPVFVKWLSGEAEIYPEGEASRIVYDIRLRHGLQGMRVRLIAEDGEVLTDRCLVREGEVILLLIEQDTRQGICRRRTGIIESVEETEYGPVVYWVQSVGEEYEIYLLSRKSGIWSYSMVIGGEVFLKKMLEVYKRV